MSDVIVPTTAEPYLLTRLQKILVYQRVSMAVYGLAVEVHGRARRLMSSIPSTGSVFRNDYEVIRWHAPNPVPRVLFEGFHCNPGSAIKLE